MARRQLGVRYRGYEIALMRKLVLNRLKTTGGGGATAAALKVVFSYTTTARIANFSFINSCAYSLPSIRIARLLNESMALNVFKLNARDFRVRVSCGKYGALPNV